MVWVLLPLEGKLRPAQDLNEKSLLWVHNEVLQLITW